MGMPAGEQAGGSGWQVKDWLCHADYGIEDDYVATQGYGLDDDDGTGELTRIVGGEAASIAATRQDGLSVYILVLGQLEQRTQHDDLARAKCR